MVEEYKYLGWAVDEHLQCMRMVEERGKAKARALSDWLRRCRATVGEVRGATFRSLMEILVDTIVWGRSMYVGVESSSNQ